MNLSRDNFPLKEEEMIHALRERGSLRKKAEEQLFQSHTWFIREGVRKYQLTQEESFDAYSDTILAAIVNITNGAFEGRSSLKTYLFQIFQRKCVDLIRKRTTNKSQVHQTTDLTAHLTSLSDSARSIIQQLIEKTEWDKLRKHLDELGERCRQLLLSYADGETDRQIAQAMGYKTPDVVKTSRLRCLDKLRQLYTSETKKD